MLNCRSHFKIDAIHGFLGRGSDWDFVFEDSFLEEHGWDLKKYELSRDLCEETGMAFEVDVQSGPAILMGYSLGGRLALQALLKEPARWKAAVIISAHPGLLHGVDDPEKKARFLSDQHWAKHILEDPWEDWVLRWNQQSVFHRGGASLLRRECDFSRTQLARLLMHFSLGKQGDLRSELSHLKVPILWISGEYDARYQNIVHEMSLLNPHFQKGIVLGAGHRVPWDRPVEFREQMILFLKKICVQIE